MIEKKLRKNFWQRLLGYMKLWMSTGTTHKANDTEAKFQLCNNLFCIIDAESEEEIELREMLMEQIKDEPATVEYVHNFLTNREEK